MEPVKVTFQPDRKTVQAQPGEKVLEIAAREGVNVNNLCGGQGVCGKCRVKVLEGKTRFTGKGVGYLSRKELEEGYVLACQTEVLEGHVEILIPPESRKEDEQILTTDRLMEYDEPVALEEERRPGVFLKRQPLSQKFYVELPEPTLDDNLSDLERIYRDLRKQTSAPTLQTYFGCLPELASMLRSNDWKATVTLYLREMDHPHIRVIEPGDTRARNYGVAIDVGTTTIVTQLVDLNKGEVVGVEASHNRQARYGEDVISRMIFACSRKGLDPLKNAVVNTINTLLKTLVEKAGIDLEDIMCFVGAGNTTMTHLLLGLEPCHIRLAPYIPTATQFPAVQAHNVGLMGHPQSILHCMPCVSSYVGGDITAGVFACGIHDRPEIGALIDVGTNGEIVIGNNEWLVCCSASAGPAFEGGGTKCGMRATRGAVEKINIRDGKVFYETIGKAGARGLCGSGLIDAMAELVQARIIDQGGSFIDLDHPHVRVVEDVPEFVVAFGEETETGEDVAITEDDISNLIKSKGAILAAMKVLLESLGMGFEDLDHVYLAGGFGTHLNVERTIFIGLLPDVPRERIHFVGNSSLAGARRGLLSAQVFHKIESIARTMTYFELSVHPDYMNEFVAALFLPHTQMELFPSVRAMLESRG